MPLTSLKYDKKYSIMNALIDREMYLLFFDFSGDHKQLRPSPAVYKLAQNYKFDISLFERMLANNMHWDVLKVQHRMRPEIVQLIVPTIYPELKNHSSVLQFERIRGMLKSVFFITHNHPEEEVSKICSHLFISCLASFHIQVFFSLDAGTVKKMYFLNRFKVIWKIQLKIYKI